MADETAGHQKPKDDKMSTISITGYERDGACEHCGKPLVHCIRLDDGRMVGATCFDKVITKPRMYSGKPYRLGAPEIIRYAKAMEAGKIKPNEKYKVTFELAA